jgi:hypothetical protein
VQRNCSGYADCYSDHWHLPERRAPPLPTSGAFRAPPWRWRCYIGPHSRPSRGNPELRGPPVRARADRRRQCNVVTVLDPVGQSCCPPRTFFESSSGVNVRTVSRVSCRAGFRVDWGAAPRRVFLRIGHSLCGTVSTISRSLRSLLHYQRSGRTMRCVRARKLGSPRESHSTHALPVRRRRDINIS